MRIILASASPRRSELLQQAGYEFDIIPSSIEEVVTETTPDAIVMELSKQKALDVFAHNASADTLVIGSDTIVSYEGEVLGKPQSEAEALDMLSLLSDRTHQVFTGVTLVSADVELIDGIQVLKPHITTFFEKTDVTFYPIDRSDLLLYIASGDPMDKAGAYGIQGSFAIHIKSIQGDYNNVVGLPIGRLYQEMKAYR